MNDHPACLLGAKPTVEGVEAHPDHEHHATVNMENRRGCCPRIVGTQTCVCLYGFDSWPMDRCFLYACYGNPLCASRTVEVASTVRPSHHPLWTAPVASCPCRGGQVGRAVARRRAAVTLHGAFAGDHLSGDREHDGASGRWRAPAKAGPLRACCANLWPIAARLQ